MLFVAFWINAHAATPNTSSARLVFFQADKVYEYKSHTVAGFKTHIMQGKDFETNWSWIHTDMFSCCSKQLSQIFSVM